MRYALCPGERVSVSPNRRRRSNPDFFLLVFRFDWSLLIDLTICPSLQITRHAVKEHSLHNPQG